MVEVAAAAVVVGVGSHSMMSFGRRCLVTGSAKGLSSTWSCPAKLRKPDQ